MAEAIGLAASVIAVVQLSGAIAKICRGYIEGVQDYPSDLRRVLVEVNMLKALFEDLNFLEDCDKGSSPVLSKLDGEDGPVEECRRILSELLNELPPAESSPTTTSAQSGSLRKPPRKKRRVVQEAVDRLAWPLRANKVQKLLAELAQYKSTITMTFTSELVHDVKDVKNKLQDISLSIDEISKRTFREWLTMTNPSSFHNNTLKLHEPGTGDWVSCLPEWDDWLNRKTRSLWIHGIPGAGKTVLFLKLITLMQTHLESIGNPRIGHAFYYCHHGRNQNEAAPFLRWVLGQLSLQSATIPKIIFDIFSADFVPTCEQLFLAIEQTLECFDAAYICLDAIDESQPHQDLLDVVREVLTDPRFEKIQLLSTSREYIGIERCMEQSSIPISMNRPAVTEDIRLYVTKILARNRNFRYWAPKLTSYAEDQLTEGAKGMFRSAVCQIDLLRRSAASSEDEIRYALHSTPKDLDKTYEQIFEVIANEAPVLVLSGLRWIELNMHQANYPNGVPLSFMVYILLGPNSSSKLPLAPYKEQEEWLRDMAGCLIQIDPEYESVSFAHHTVREFLRSDRIASSCAKYFQLDHSSVILQCAPILLQQIPNAIQEGKFSKSLNWAAYTYWEDSVRFLYTCTEDELLGRALLRQESLRELIFAFLRQKRLRNSCIWFQPGLSCGSNWFYTEQVDEDSDPIVLLRLVLVGAYKLADYFLDGKDSSFIFRTRLCLARYEAFLAATTQPASISGTIIELGSSIVLGELGSSSNAKFEELFRILEFLCAKGAGHFNPSFALASLALKTPPWARGYACSLRNLDPDICKNSERCLAHILSDQGADPSWADPSWVAPFLNTIQTLVSKGELPGTASLVGMNESHRNMIQPDLNLISGLKLDFSLKTKDPQKRRELLVEVVDK